MANILPMFLLVFLLVSNVEADVQPFSKKCPPQCNCSIKKGKPKVDCRGKGLQEMLPSKSLPSEMLVLDLSRNNITVVKSFSLDRHKQLEKLYLQKNNIRVIEERAFVGLSNLNRLVMKQNNLIKLKPRAFVGLPQLDSLDLSVNKIKSIDKDAFSGLDVLTRLNLNNNSFRSIENGTFDSLKKLKKLYLRNTPLRCDCDLNPFIYYITHSQTLTKYDGTCFHSKTRLAALAGSNLCVKPPVLSVYPKVSQVVAYGDGLHIECRSEEQEALHLGWTKNDKALLKKHNIFVRTRTFRRQIISSVDIRYISVKDAGVYTCSSDRLGVIPKNVTIDVVSSEFAMCTSQAISTDVGHFIWPVTFSGTTKKIPCPSLGHRNYSDTAVRRTCSQEGAWGEVNYGNCHWVPFSEQLITLESLTNTYSMLEITSKLKTVTVPVKFQYPKEISLVLNVMAAINAKYADQLYPVEVLNNLLEIFDNLMNVDRQILFNAQKNDQAPSRLASHLELISRKSALKLISRVLSNIVIGSVHLKKDGFEGKTCRVYFRTGNHSSSNGLQCRPQKRKDHVVSIHFPKTIFSDLEAAGIKKEELVVQLLIYRNAKLFPNVVTNNTEEMIKERDVSSSILAIQLASIKELNLTEPFLLSFKTNDGTDPVVSNFDFGEKVIGRPWSPNTDCQVKGSSSSKTTVHCQRLVNKNLAIMSILKSVSVMVYSLEVVVYLGAVIAALFMLATLVTFTVYRKLRFNCDDVLVLMNACLSLLIVMTTFAFGIDRAETRTPCRIVGVLLHFFFLASLLWLGSYVVCVSRKLKQTKESEEEFTPVMRYYMVSWGVPAIICGITLAGDLDNYHTTEYCWLTESAGLGAFVGPACLLFIINCVLLVRLHVLLARGGLSRQPSVRNSEEERLQDEEPAVTEITLQPENPDVAEKSMLTLYLVATWVVMALIYVNFIVAYLLIKFRRVTLTWKFLSYVYALANITLGASVFLFHCMARSDVRECWKKTWIRVKSIRWYSCSCRRTLGLIRSVMAKKSGTNGVILATGQVNPGSDRQSNITLPSSAALTNDVFANGRPLSTARISLLDEADFPNPEDASGAVNEVDITLSEDGGHPQSQTSVTKGDPHLGSNPPSEAPTPSAAPTYPENSVTGSLLSEINDEIQADITSKSESSAPTAIEVPLTSTPQQQSPPRVNTNQAPAVDSLSSRSSSSIGVDPSVKVLNAKRKRSSESLNSGSRTGSTAGAPRLRKIPLQNGYPSSSGELVPRNTIQKRQRFGDLAIMHEVNHPLMPPNMVPQNITSQRMIIPNMAPQIAMNMCPPDIIALQNMTSQYNGLSCNMPPQNIGSQTAASANIPTKANPAPKNCYKDGREKPEPKQWVGNGARQMRYVPVPHVSKIHRAPDRNETSV